MIYFAHNYRPRWLRLRYVMWRATIQNAVIAGIVWLVYISWHAGTPVWLQFS
jgi:hypothetical protein